jgi:hypothetical protein
MSLRCLLPCSYASPVSDYRPVLRTPKEHRPRVAIVCRALHTGLQRALAARATGDGVLISESDHHHLLGWHGKESSMGLDTTPQLRNSEAAMDQTREQTHTELWKWAQSWPVCCFVCDLLNVKQHTKQCASFVTRHVSQLIRELSANAVLRGTSAMHLRNCLGGHRFCDVL